MALSLPAPAAREVVDQLAAIVGPEQVSVAPIDRLTYARDMYTVAIIKHAEGKLEHFPHVIVWPANEDELIRVVKLAPDLGLPVIPFGAGSGVCGGTLPIHGGIMLDVKRLGRIVEINDDDLTVTAQAGINGQVLEMELNRHGYTLGHFPSSIHCSTLGGWVAARSAGQLSSKYGKIEDMLIALRWVCPDGRVYSSPIVPGRSTGPDFDQILTGSEGTLGVCTEATLRICPYPADRRFVAFTFPDVPTATEAMRMMLRNDLRPAAMRLYDALDTMLVGTSGSTEHTQGKSLGDLLQIEQIGNRVRTLAPDLFRKAQRFVAGNAQIANQLELLAKEGCMLILMFEGERELTDYEFEAAVMICERLGGTNKGPKPAIRWFENRHHVSYKMSKVYYNGAFVDTIEVATTWTRLIDLYDAVCAALKPHAFLMAHFSHAYPDGCSIYFTFVTSAADADEAATKHAFIWSLAMKAAGGVGATLSHHHGIGLSKAQYMRDEHGDMMRVYRDIKTVMDDAHRFNPGKMGL